MSAPRKRETKKWLCPQRRLRSALESAQSDQTLGLALKRVAKGLSYIHAASEDSD